MKLPKLIVAVAASEARMNGVGEAKRTQRATSGGAAGSVGGSTGGIEPRQSADTTKDAASASSATGADASWTRRPPALGPATNDSARLPYMAELASTKRSRGTSETNSELAQTRKTTDR